MVRPRRCRIIEFLPSTTYFKPQGIKLKNMQIVELTLDELECLRLSEIEELSQIESAERMQVHQSTFQRNLTSARKKIATALIKGLAIKIQGGAYKMPNRDKTGPEGKGPKTGRGLGPCAEGESKNNKRPFGRGRRCGRTD